MRDDSPRLRCEAGSVLRPVPQEVKILCALFEASGMRPWVLVQVAGREVECAMVSL
jgi:hypothetical protein